MSWTADGGLYRDFGWEGKKKGYIYGYSYAGSVISKLFWTAMINNKR